MLLLICKLFRLLNFIKFFKIKLHPKMSEQILFIQLSYFLLPLKILMKGFPTFLNSLWDMQKGEKNILLRSGNDKYNPRDLCSILIFKDRIFGIHRDICIAFVCDPLKQLGLFPELCNCSLGLQCNSRKRCISFTELQIVRHIACMFHSTCLPLNFKTRCSLTTDIFIRFKMFLNLYL